MTNVPDSHRFSSVLETPQGGQYRRIPDPEHPRMTSHIPPEKAAQKRMEVVQWLQLIGIVIAVAGIFMAIGRRDQTLEDLKTIVNRLVDSDLHLRERMSTMEGQILQNNNKP